MQDGELPGSKLPEADLRSVDKPKQFHLIEKGAAIELAQNQDITLEVHIENSGETLYIPLGSFYHTSTSWKYELDGTKLEVPNQGMLTIGRPPDDDTAGSPDFFGIDNKFVSRNHLNAFIEEGRLIIHVQGKNPTYIKASAAEAHSGSYPVKERVTSTRAALKARTIALPVE